MPAGTNSVQAAASGFTTSTQTVAVPANGTATLNFVLSPTLPAGQFRIVLTCGAQPSDLDLHLWVPINGGTSFSEVDYRTEGSLTSSPFAQLDVDDIAGFGPETTTIAQVLPGTYTFGVCNFSTNSAGATPITASGARVQVFGSQACCRHSTCPPRGLAYGGACSRLAAAPSHP